MNRQKLNYGLLIFGVLGLSLLLQFLLPFPIGLITALGFYIMFPYLIKKIAKSRYGKHFINNSMYEAQRSLERTCISCGWQTKKDPCPRCGKRAFGYK